MTVFTLIIICSVAILAGGLLAWAIVAVGAGR
jgi:hypothetical protein